MGTHPLCKLASRGPIQEYGNIQVCREYPFDSPREMGVGKSPLMPPLDDWTRVLILY